jgi:hypothetical protein
MGVRVPPLALNVMVRSIYIALLLLIPPVAAGCAVTPEQTLHTAFAALCSENPAAFAASLTPRSALLYNGLVATEQSKFSCLDGASALTISDTGVRKEGLRILTVEQGSVRIDIALVQEQGKWLIDLFFTEESLFFSPSELVLPASGSDGEEP